MKAKKVDFIAKGYNVVTPYLSVNDAAGAIAFYKKVFGAKEVMRMPGPRELSAMRKPRSITAALCWPTNFPI